MKLLHCQNCNDVKALYPGEWTVCWCGRSRGKYVDSLYAVVDGEYAVPLGLLVESLEAASDKDEADREAGVRRKLGHCFEAFVIPWSSPRVSRPRQCPCGKDKMIGSPVLDPVECACGRWSVDYHSTGGSRLLDRRRNGTKS